MTQAASKSKAPAAAPHARSPARHPKSRCAGSAVHALHGIAGNRAVSGALGAGEPLAPDVREEMEARFGADFADVRVHCDARAHASAASLNANAYTHQHDIVFGAGRYAPHQSHGRRLIAHELAHVVQQRRNAPVDVGSVEPPGSAAEREADAIAGDVAAGRTAQPASAAPQGITRDAGWARSGEIPDVHGMGYNTIFRNAGPESRDAVLGLSALETPSLFVNIDAFKKLEASQRKAILGLEPHAAGTACAGWFDLLRANDPDRPEPTAEEQRAGMAAYYGSMRDDRLQKKTEAARADVPKLAPVDIDARWKENHDGFIGAAQTPGHGIKAEQLHAIWIKYWSDRYKLASDLRQATLKRAADEDMEGYMRKWGAYEGGDRDAFGGGFAKADADVALGDLLFRYSTYALEICRSADAQGSSLTLDELTQRTVDFAKGREPFVQAIEQIVTIRPGPVSRAPARNQPVKTEPVKSGVGKSEPVKTEPVKTEPVKTKPVKTEPVKSEPVKQPAVGDPPMPAAKPKTSAKSKPAADAVPPASPEPAGKLEPPVTEKPAALPKPTARPKPAAKPKAAAKPETVAKPKPKRPSPAKQRIEDAARPHEERFEEQQRKLGESRGRTREYFDERAAAGRSRKGGPKKGIDNAKERMWLLNRQKAYPKRQILGSAEIKGVRMPDGKLVPPKKISKGITGREPDFFEIDGQKVNAGELKSEWEINRSLKGGPGTPEGGKTAVDPGSKLGQEWGTEDTIVKYARDRSGKIVVGGYDLKTGKYVERAVDPADFGRSLHSPGFGWGTSTEWTQ